MTFERAANLLYECVNSDEKLQPAHLLEHMMQVAMTHNSLGARLEAEQTWLSASFEERWVFCQQVGKRGKN